MDDERAQIDAARARTGFKGPIPGAGEALRMAELHGDFAGIVLRGRLGISLTPGELAAIERLERGAALRTVPKDPATDAAETVVCWRWLVERSGWTPTRAQSLLAEMMGAKSSAIRARIERSKGLARNIADLCFQVHVQRDRTPALLRHRMPNGYCATCRKTRCRCEPAPRPAFAETPEGAQVAVLLSFWRGPEKPGAVASSSPPAGDDGADGRELWRREAWNLSSPPETTTRPPEGDHDPDGWETCIQGGDGPAR